MTDETGTYSQVKRVGKPSTQEPEALTVKPKLAEEGLTPRSQRTVAADYEKLPDFDDQKANSIKRENPYELDGENTPVPPPPIRKVGEREVEAVIKSRTVNGEDTYEPVVWRKYSDSKFDEISLSDPPSLKERLQQEAGQKLTFTETSVSNTDYVPKKLSKKEIEALSEKARKAAESKDPHEATMEKIKKIAEDPNNIPKEHLLSKLEEYTYGYKNDDVIRLANRSAEEGTKLIVPDMVDKSKITKQDQKNLGEIMEKLPFSDDYNQFRRQVDEKIYDKLSNNPEFKDLMNKPLSGNEANIQKLFDIVVQAKKDSFKELAGVDIETPKLVLNKDKNQKVHGEYLDDTVTMGAVPPIKSKKQEDHNKELLNTIIHELTHHDQAYLAGNKDNPNLKRNLQEEARVFGVNQDLYVPIDSHKHGYKEQPLERDAFRAGDALSDRLMKKVYQGSEESDLKGIGNTDYIPKPITKKQREALEKKAKKYQQSEEFTDSYNNFRKNMDKQIFENLSRDSQFKQLMKGELNGNPEKVKELIGVITKAKKTSFESLGENNFPKSELKLKEEVSIVSNARTKEAQNEEILNNILKQYTYRAGDDFSEKLMKKIGVEIPKESSRRSARVVEEKNYVPKQFTAEEREALFQQAKEKYENRDSEKEATKKLKTISEAAENLPKEHLVKALQEITSGRKFDETAALYNKAKETGIKNIVRPDTLGEFSGENAKVMGDIYKKVQFDDNYIKAREEINKKTLEKLDSKKEFHDLMKQKLSGNEERIRKLYDMVESAKRESLEEVTGVKSIKPDLEIRKGGQFGFKQGTYKDDMVRLNENPLFAFAKTTKKNNKQLLDNIIHELTHHDQGILTRSRKNPNLKDSLRPDIDLLDHNFKYYIRSKDNFFTYQKQPVEREAFLSGHKLAEDLSQALDRGYRGEKANGIGNTDYIPKKLTKQEQEQLFKESRQKAKERDSAKEAEKKLKLLADNADSIPKEHMLKSLKELAYGLSMEDTTALHEKAKDTNKKVHRPDTLEGFEGQNVGNMGKVLRKIQFDPEYIKTREEINQRIIEKLDNSREFHDLMKGKLSGNEEGIKKLFTLVEQAKHDSLQEITGIDGKRVDLNIYKSNPLAMKQGYYKDDVVNMGDVPLFSFLRSKKQNNKEILNTIIHELTHHDQAQIRNNRHKDIPEHMKNDSDLLILNETYYISPTSGHFKSYKEQPMEREAFLSGDKLGQQLSKLVDKGYGGRSKEIEEIVHLPSKNKNLEADREAGAAFGDSALIYGLKDGRKELLIKANKADKEKKNPIIADSYIGELNLGFEFSRLSELANKVNSGKVSEQEIDRIVNYRDPNMDSAVSDSLNRINKANVEDNKRVLTELLQNETVIDSLKRMDNLNQREKVLTESLKKNESLDLDEPTESPNYTTKQNEEIREYNQIKKDLNDARMDFFAEKTKLIAKKVLDEGGQLYFSLDGLATDSMRFNKDRTVIDMNRLKEVFNPESEHYNAVTSKELRYLYENYKDNPNLKFMIKDQIIENPLKTLEIPKQKQAPATEDSSDGRERRILPKLFKKSKTEKGPVIKHLGGDDTKDSFYFPLDKIVTKNGNISKNMTVNMDNIKKAFNPKDKHYNSPEAKSLRAMYEQDHTMASTKFIVGNQVIANPFTNPELQQYIQEHKKEVEKKATGLKKKPELPEKPRKIKAKPITEDSRQKAVIFYTPEEMTTRSDKIVSQTSQSPSKEPVYADIQFKNRRKEGKVLRNSEETIYEEVKGKSLSTPSREKAVIFYTPEEMTTRSDKIVSQTSQSPSKEPVYADIQFKNRRKEGKVLRNSEETIYEEVGRKVEEPIYENVPRRKK